MPFGVLKHFHPMIGGDRHIVMPPGSPAPGPPAPHLAMSSLVGFKTTAELGPAEYSHFGWTMMRGTDIGPLIPHAGPPNCLLPMILLSSASKSNFGSSTHKIEGKPVAVALGIVVNPNLNCGDPIAAPLDGVIALTAHFVGMTWGDFWGGVFEMALDIGLQYAIGKLCDKLFDRITLRVYEKFLAGPLGGALERMGFGRVSTWLLQHDFQEMVLKGFGAKLAKMVGADLVGSPLGYSFPINGFGVLDTLLGKGTDKAEGNPDSHDGAMQKGYNAVHDYVDSPSVDSYDVPPAQPDAAASDAGADAGNDAGPASDADAAAASDADAGAASDANAGAASNADAGPVDDAGPASDADADLPANNASSADGTPTGADQNVCVDPGTDPTAGGAGSTDVAPDAGADDPDAGGPKGDR